MRRLFWLPFLVFFASAPAAGIQVFNPPDKLLSFDEIVMLEGKFAPFENFNINGTAFSAKFDGSFSCGLVLGPGKNLAEIRAGDELKKIRILRLNTYPDIEESYDGKKHWARGQIVYLSTLGIIEGYPDGDFHPGNPVTRGELATWLARAKKLPLPKLTEDVFFDVPKEHWRAPYIKAAVAAGYLRGYSDATFGLADPIFPREAGGGK